MSGPQAGKISLISVLPLLHATLAPFNPRQAIRVARSVLARLDAIPTLDVGLAKRCLGRVVPTNENGPSEDGPFELAVRRR